MKNQIMKFLSIAILSLLIASCNSSSNKNNMNSNSDSISKSDSEIKELTNIPKTDLGINSDSTELTTLIRNLYKWHEEKDYTRPDFPTTERDSFYIGINWALHKERMVYLEKTNFFSKEFFYNYNKIAIQIDSFIKIDKTKTKFIPPFDTDGDDWCGCQWSPENYWETITISNLNNFKDSATFKWNWIPSRKELYFVKAKKENDVWKISYLEGFRSRDYLFTYLK